MTAITDQHHHAHLLIIPPAVHIHASSLAFITAFHCSVHAQGERVKLQESTLIARVPAADSGPRSDPSVFHWLVPLCPLVSSPSSCVPAHPSQTPITSHHGSIHTHGDIVQPQESTLTSRAHVATCQVRSGSAF